MARQRISRLAVASAVAGALSVAVWALLPANRLLHLLLVLGPSAVLLGLVALLLGPVAILLAISACVVIRPASGVRGRRWAAAGLVLGCIGFVFSPTWGRLQHDWKASRKSQCMSNVREVGEALALYSSDFNGGLPQGGDPRKSTREALKIASPSDAPGTTH
jgi:hypothetical protein